MTVILHRWRPVTAGDSCGRKEGKHVARRDSKKEEKERKKGGCGGCWLIKEKAG
jgi:hypothetical protein